MEEDPEKMTTGYTKKVFPDGVNPEKLEGWNIHDIVATMPDGVKSLITQKDAMELYEEFVKAVDDAPRRFTGGFKLKEVESIEADFQKRFNEKGIRVFLCDKVMLLGKGYKTFKWLEFVDVSKAPDYVPKEQFGDGNCNV